MLSLKKSLIWLFVICLVFLGVLTVIVWPDPTQAATDDLIIVVDTTDPSDVDDVNCSLIEAIIAANSYAPYHGCTASGTLPGTKVVIYLQASAFYILTAVHNVTDGANGLPAISSPISPIVIEGQDATISRDGSAPNFRIFYVGSGGDLTLSDLTVAGGSTQTSGSWWEQSGGGLMSKGSATIIRSTFKDNVAHYGGGGIYCWGPSLTVSDTTLNGNRATGGPGGGIGGGGAMTMTNSALMDNYASSNGGGLYLFSMEGIKIIGTTVTSNTAGGDAGGLYLQTRFSISSLEDVTISGNAATSGRGGGLHVAGYSILNRVTIDNNRSGDNGGGIYLTTYEGAGSLEMTNATVYSNTAQASGGGLYANYSGWGVPTAVIAHTTFASNTATIAGGNLYNNQSTINLASSIVAYGAAGTGGATNCDGNPSANLTSSDYNVESGTDCGLTATNDQQNSDPRLGLLRDNGGDTHTAALLTGSPAIALVPEGINGCGTTITIDQRGRTRIIPCDVGAYEYVLSVYLPLALRSY